SERPRAGLERPVPVNVEPLVRALRHPVVGIERDVGVFHHVDVLHSEGLAGPEHRGHVEAVLELVEHHGERARPAGHHRVHLLPPGREEQRVGSGDVGPLLVAGSPSALHRRAFPRLPLPAGPGLDASLARDFPADVERPETDGFVTRAVSPLDRVALLLAGVAPFAGETVAALSAASRRGRRRGLGWDPGAGTPPPDSTWAMASSSAPTPSPVAPEMGKTGSPRFAIAARKAGNRSRASGRSIFDGATSCGLAASLGL